MIRLIIIITICISHLAFAKKGDESSGGLSFEAALGSPNVKLVNPNDTEATYSGIGLLGRGSYGFLDSNKFNIRVNISMKYLDLKSTANIEAQKELGNHIGYGGGIAFDIFNFVLGGDYYYMAARHYSIGAISKSLEYSYSPLNMYGGLRVEFGKISIGAVYSMSTATLAKSTTKLSKDSPYSDAAVWVNLTINTGKSIGGFAKVLLD